METLLFIPKPAVDPVMLPPPTPTPSRATPRSHGIFYYVFFGFLSLIGTVFLLGIIVVVCLASYASHNRAPAPAPIAIATATNRVSGAFGFVLGDKFASDEAQARKQYPDGWSMGDDGGYSALPEAPPPFHSVLVSADDAGRIYSLTAYANDEFDVSELYKTTLKLLSERYPQYRTLTDGAIFGDELRSAEIRKLGNSVSVTYCDHELEIAFWERSKKSKEEATRRALGGKL